MDLCRKCLLQKCRIIFASWTWRIDVWRLLNRRNQELHDLVERLKTENQQLVKEQQLQAQQHEEMKRIPGTWKGPENKLRYEQIPGGVQLKDSSVLMHNTVMVFHVLFVIIWYNYCFVSIMISAFSTSICQHCSWIQIKLVVKCKSDWHR